MEFFNKNTFNYFYFLSCVIFFCEAARISRRDIVFGTPTYSGIKTERMCNGYTTQACNGILTSQQNTGSPAQSVSNASKKFTETNDDFVARKRLSRSAGNQQTRKLTDNSETQFEINVVGGRQTKPKEYPHMALIGYGNYSEVKWLCGGTLISENFVMSAAHCVTSNEGTPTWIRLAELNLASTSEDARVVDIPITQVIVHPDYKSPVQYNDIALFKFKSLNSFSEYIRPICLNIFQELPNQNVTVAGWGSTGYGEIGSQQLLSVDMDLQRSEQCDSLYRGPRLPNGFNASTQICAGYAPGGRDSCQGDSGGPLQIVNYRAGCTTVPIYKQIGIVSFGENCALPDTPGVYTRVSFFIPWIESIVWK